MRKYKLFILTLMFSVLLVVSVSGQKRSQRVSLSVTIHNIGEFGPSGILGDGYDYIDGTNSVTAGIDEYGWFGFNSGTRQVTANYERPIEPTNATLPGSETRTGANFKTFVTNLKFQDMKIEEVQCVGAALTFNYSDSAGTQRSSGYRRGDSNSAWAKVTRVDLDTWTIESATYLDKDSNPSCSMPSDPSLDHVAIVRERKTKGKTTPEITFGSYTMPFKITLRRRL